MNLTSKSIATLVAIALITILVLVHFPILGVAGFLALGALIGSGVKWGQDRKQTLILSEHLTSESRLLLRPVRRLAAFNREIARKHRVPLEQTATALDETEGVVRQCIRWLQVRDQLVMLRASIEEAESHLADSRARLEEALTDDERMHLEQAIPALESQVAQRDRVRQQLDEIDGRVMLAQYSLEHLKTMLTVSAMQADVLDEIPANLGQPQSGIALGG